MNLHINFHVHGMKGVDSEEEKEEKADKEK